MKLGYKILKRLEEVHSAGIVFNDLKPENIMVDNGEVHLIDFGFATRYVYENGKHIEPMCIECF
jgi:serine/threonine protein kinase